MGDAEGAHGADGIAEKGVGAVEGVYVTEIRSELGPTCSLDGAGDFKGKLVESQLPFVGGDAAFQHEAAEVAVGADVVETVVVHAGMGDVKGHEVDHFGADGIKEFGVAGSIELKDSGAVLKALGPLGPAAGGVLAADGEHGGTVGGLPCALDVSDFGCGKFVELFNGGQKRRRGQGGIDFEHESKPSQMESAIDGNHGAGREREIVLEDGLDG